MGEGIGLFLSPLGARSFCSAITFGFGLGATGFFLGSNSSATFGADWETVSSSTDSFVESARRGLGERIGGPEVGDFMASATGRRVSFGFSLLASNMRTNADVGAIGVSSGAPTSFANIGLGELRRLPLSALPSLSEPASTSLVLPAGLPVPDGVAALIILGLASACDFADEGVYLAAARVAAIFEGDMARLFGEPCGTLKVALGGG